MKVGGTPFGDDKAGVWSGVLLVLVASARVGWALFRGLRRE